MLAVKKELLAVVLVLVLATLACTLGTPSSSSEPNLEATIVALQQTQSAPAAPAASPAVQAPASPTTAAPASPTAAAPAAPVATATSSTPMLSVSVNTNCRTGPGIRWAITDGLTVGASYVVKGQAPSSTNSYVIVDPGSGKDCWAWLEHATITGNIGALPVISVPPVPVGSISGFVWLEDCDDLFPGNTCVTINGLPEGDGSFKGEVGISGVPVELFSGACPPATSVGTTTTSNGTFKFEKLEAGKYCIKINDSFLSSSAALGGTFTFPIRGASVQTHQVELLPGENKKGFIFGWDDFEQ
jgi:uncharacterized protein YraI/ribosomal protein L33